MNDAYFGKLFYSTNGGATWIQSTTTYSQIANWTQTTVTNPAFDNQLNLRFFPSDSNSIYVPRLIFLKF